MKVINLQSIKKNYKNKNNFQAPQLRELQIEDPQEFRSNLYTPNFSLLENYNPLLTPIPKENLFKLREYTP